MRNVLEARHELQQVINDGGLNPVIQNATGGTDSVPAQAVARQILALLGLGGRVPMEGVNISLDSVPVHIDAIVETATLIHAAVDAGEQSVTSRLTNSLPFTVEHASESLATEAAKLLQAMSATSVFSLLRQKPMVMEQLARFADELEKLHHHLDSKLGETHDTALIARHAYMDAHVAKLKTLVRMLPFVLASKLGSKLANLPLNLWESLTTGTAQPENPPPTEAPHNPSGNN
jgi:hypothetical protein